MKPAWHLYARECREPCTFICTHLPKRHLHTKSTRLHPGPLLAAGPGGLLLRDPWGLSKASGILWKEAE